jgi:hypothetical protein
MCLTLCGPCNLASLEISALGLATLRFAHLRRFDSNGGNLCLRAISVTWQDTAERVKEGETCVSVRNVRLTHQPYSWQQKAIYLAHKRLLFHS